MKLRWFLQMIDTYSRVGTPEFEAIVHIILHILPQVRGISFCCILKDNVKKSVSSLTLAHCKMMTRTPKITVLEWPPQMDISMPLRSGSLRLRAMQCDSLDEQD